MDFEVTEVKCPKHHAVCGLKTMMDKEERGTRFDSNFPQNSTAFDSILKNVEFSRRHLILLVKTIKKGFTHYEKGIHDLRYPESYPGKN
jgi:hypothetical protein